MNNFLCSIILKKGLFLLITLLLFLFFSNSITQATVCVSSDNGSGTVDLPVDCPYATLPDDPMVIIDGLPPGTTIELDATIHTYTCNHNTGLCTLPLAPQICETVGGSLGGSGHCFEATLELSVSGTGMLTGFNRTLWVPISAEIHTGPRNPGDPVQQFPIDLFRLQGELFGDPDFCSFIVTGGTDFGLPSPGQSTLNDQGNGTFWVESFFDITYQIEFEGCPGSVLDGFMGTTTATTRFNLGEPYVDHWQPGDGHKMHFPQLPDEEGWDIIATFPIQLGDDWECSETGWVKDIHFWGSWKNGLTGDIENFNIKIYDDVPAGVDMVYSHPGDLLWERNIGNYNMLQIVPQTFEGWYNPVDEIVMPMNHQEYFQYDIILDEPDWFWQEQNNIYWLVISAYLNSQEQEEWGWKSSVNHWNDDAVWGFYEQVSYPCVEPDNGTGTVDFPGQCPYMTYSEDPMYIIDGLPPGTEMVIDATLLDYYNIVVNPGGSLGGEIVQFDATVEMVVTGQGSLTGLVRYLAVPVICEMHLAPRTPGDPIQSFSTDFFRMQGELFGDPDFCTFRFTAGTDFGLPSPGNTVLTELPSGDFAVESFFDVTYQIEFEGCPGSPLDNYMGITTGTSRMTKDETSGSKNSNAICNVSDNGSGTIDLPADCPYETSEEPMLIIDGLPPGSSIEMDAILGWYFNNTSQSGGSLGGEIHMFEAVLDLTCRGTGDLNGFNRHIAVPVVCEIHSGPRTPGDPIQSFSTDFFRMQGELFGDPDFCTFRFTAGTDFGLPSPGNATLTDLEDGTYWVESFFDVTYQIEFEGCPGSVLEGYMGTTTATSRFDQGEAQPALWNDLYEPPDFIQSLDLAFVITGESPSCCDLAGDANNDSTVGISDITFFVDYMFNNGPPPPCMEEFDNNNDCTLGISDLTFFVDYMFNQGVAPNCFICP